MKKTMKTVGAVALSFAMTVTALPGAARGAETAEDYVYDTSYTIGFSTENDSVLGGENGSIVAYKNGQKLSLEDAGVTVYNNKGDDPFASENEQAWDAGKLTLAKPLQYTDENGVTHDVESTLTGFDLIADPTAIDNSDVDGKLYVYGTTEAITYYNNDPEHGNDMRGNQYANHSLSILSTTDMVNWTDEGFMDSWNLENVPEAPTSRDPGRYSVSGFTSSGSWAPSGLKYDYDGDGTDTYYLFYTNGADVGYVMGPSPTGPWTEPEGRSTFGAFLPNCNGGGGNFDPAVLMDDDGYAYVYFGGWKDSLGRTRLWSKSCKFTFNQESGRVEIVGEPVNLPTYCHYEDNEINKFNGKYYYSYCTDDNNTEEYPQTLTKPVSIAVYVSSDPLNIAFDPTTRPAGKEFEAFTDGDGTYRHFLGTVLANTAEIYGESYNNHHHMQEFRNNMYIFYHSTVLHNFLHRTHCQYRNLHVDEISLNPETEEIKCKSTFEGPKQIGSYNLYNNIAVDKEGKEVIKDKKTINATTTSYSAGVKSTRSEVMATEVNKGDKVKSGGSPMVLDSIETGDWTKLQGVNFGNGAVKFEANLASTTKNGAIELFIDDPTKASNMIAKVNVKDTGDIETYDTVSTTDIKPVVGVHDLYFVFRGSDYRVAAWRFDESTEPLIKEATPEPSAAVPSAAPEATTAAPASTSTPAAPTATPAATSAPAPAATPVANTAGTTAKKAGIKITGKKVVKVGKSITLRAKLTNVKGTVKWSVNKKKIAAISSKGKLKGKKPGKVKVTAKVKKVKATVTITVKKR